MSDYRNDPPIPLPKFDPYEQLGKTRKRIVELEAAIERSSEINARLVHIGLRKEREAKDAKDKLTAAVRELWRFCVDDKELSFLRRINEELGALLREKGK